MGGFALHGGDYVLRTITVIDDSYIHGATRHPT